MHDQSLTGIDELDQQIELAPCHVEVFRPEPADRVLGNGISQQPPVWQLRQPLPGGAESGGGGRDPVLGHVGGGRWLTAQPLDAPTTPVEVPELVGAQYHRCAAADILDGSHLTAPEVNPL